MPIAAISEQQLNSRDGLAFSIAAAGDVANGNYFVWGPRKIVAVRNAGGSTYNITFTPSSEDLDSFTATTRVVSIPSGAIKFIGPFPGYYKQPSDGDRVYVDVANAALLLRVYDVAQGG